MGKVGSLSAGIVTGNDFSIEAAGRRLARAAGRGEMKDKSPHIVMFSSVFTLSPSDSLAGQLYQYYDFRRPHK